MLKKTHDRILNTVRHKVEPDISNLQLTSFVCKLSVCLLLEKRAYPESTDHENKIGQPKAGKCPGSTSHFSPFNCCLTVV